MQKFSLESIGTHLSVLIDTDHSCESDFWDIHKRLITFEEKFSRFITGNWLDTLNKTRSALCDDDARAMIEAALTFSEKTEWYFDPTVGSVLSHLGYGLKTQKDKHTVSYKNIHLDGNTVTLTGDSLLEFGGVGKWYLLDVIQNILKKHTKYMINFWWDIYGRWGWKVWLEHPHNAEEAIGIIELHDNFLACSSGSQRRWWNHHHLINPHTQSSAHDVIATYIESNKWIVADGYATALCVMDFETAKKFLIESPDIEWILLASDGQYFQSEKSRAILFNS